MGVRVKKVLTKKQLDKVEKKLPDWKLNSKATQLKAKFPQPDYVSGLVFIARIAVHAELKNHHPDILYRYGDVTVTLTTHDVGGLTEKDVILAATISRLALAT
jgi:pterin-4a-carbinolamine dehydratase